MSDVEAGIEFIYNMREHVLDIGVATLYGIVVYAIILLSLIHISEPTRP